jgi:hypothetical protein
LFKIWYDIIKLGKHVNIKTADFLKITFFSVKWGKRVSIEEDRFINLPLETRSNEIRSCNIAFLEYVDGRPNPIFPRNSKIKWFITRPDETWEQSQIPAGVYPVLDTGPE